MANLTTEYLDKKLEEQASLMKQGFDAQSKRMDGLDEHMGTLDKRIDTVAHGLVETEANLKQEITDLRDELKTDYLNLMNSVDAYAKRANTFFEELVAIAHRMDRHEKWIHQIADKLGVKLEY